MKIIIKESRLINLMFAYLEDKLFPHEEVNLRDWDSIFWVKDGLIVAERRKIEDGFYLFKFNVNVANTFLSMFSLKDSDVNITKGRDYILKFLKEKHNLEVDYVHYADFEYEQESYDEGQYFSI